MFSTLSKIAINIGGPFYFLSTITLNLVCKTIDHSLNPLLHRYSLLTHQQQTAFENIVGKEHIARNEQCVLFPQCFLLGQKIISSFVNIFGIFGITSVFPAESEEPKIGV